MLNILNQILCNSLILKSNESESTRLSSIDVLKNDSVINWSELLEMLTQFITIQLEIEPANKNFGFWILEIIVFAIFFLLISVLARSTTNIRILLLDNNIRIRLGHVGKCTLLVTHLLHVLVRLHVVCWRARHLISSIRQLLILGHSQQLSGHICVARCTHSRLRLDIVIGRLHIN